MTRFPGRVFFILGLLLSYCLAAPASQAHAGAAPDQTALHTLRVRTRETGMHRLTYADLTAAGVPDGVDTATFAMRYEGAPVDIRILGSPGPLTADDVVVFFAQSFRSRYTNDNVYFFTYGGAASGARMGERPAAPSAEVTRDWAYQTVHVEFDEQYFSAYPLGSADDHFFDSPTLAVNGSAPTATNAYPLDLPGHLTSGSLRFRAQLYGGYDQGVSPDQSVKVRLNAHDVGTFSWDGRTGHKASGIAPAAHLDGAPDTLYVEAGLSQLPPISDYYVYVDWLELDYPAALTAANDRLYAPDLDLDSAASVELAGTGFTTSAVTVYDVRDTRHPVVLAGATASNLGGSYEVRFRDAWPAGSAAPRYALTTDAALIAPLAVEPADAPAWNTPDNAYDYIALTHRSLWDAAQPLLDKRAADGLRVAKVDPQHIYDQFSSGRLDPEAIRRFLSYAYHNWNAGGPRPRYALLVGDGHYDFKNALKTPLKNLVPPYLLNVDPWLGETAADNRYVAVDGPDDYMPDMAIGRIPAQDARELGYAVDKILAYENPAAAPGGAWQNMVSFVADEADNYAGNFQALSEDARLNWLPPSYNSRHIYWETDYAATADMKAGIKSAFADSLLLQWFGHASKFRWGVSGIFNTFDVPDIAPAAQWPVTVDYSCWTGYFINLFGLSQNGEVDYHSLAEKLLLTQGRGSVAVIAPSGQHVGDALQVLNQGFVKAVFQDEMQPLGDAFNAAKNYYYSHSTGWPDVIDTTLLFGDPAMKLRLIPRARPPAVSVALRAEPQSVDLAWTDLEPDEAYEVWRGESPYFEPGPDAQQVGAVDGAPYQPGDAVRFTDDGSAPPTAVIVGDPARNYFWIVRGANTTGPSGNSNRVGEFDFALTRGLP